MQRYLGSLKNSPVLISLIITTRSGRGRELSRLLESLRASGDRNLEVILVSQDCAASVTPILDQYRDCFLIKHVQHRRCGISTARNVALKYCAGGIIGFPDDDCWYPQDTLPKIRGHFQGSPNAAFVCASVIDPIRQLPFGHRRISKRKAPIRAANAFRLPISVGIFFHARQMKELPQFDDRFGAGEQWGSGEDTDLILSFLRAGYQGSFLPNVVVYHEINYEGTDVKAVEKAFNYARGFGALTAKSIYLRGQRAMGWVYIEAVTRTSARALLSVLALNPRYCRLNAARVRGMVKGFAEGMSLYGHSKGEPIADRY